MELEWLVSWHVHEGDKSKDFKAIFFWLLLFQYSIHSVYFLNECYTNFKFHGIHLLHRINPYCTVFGSHLLHRMHPYYTVIGSHLLHIINPWLHWFWFNFTLYYLYLASDYTISDYTVFQKYSIQCIPGSCCTRLISGYNDTFFSAHLGLCSIHTELLELVKLICFNFL